MILDAPLRWLDDHTGNQVAVVRKYDKPEPWWVKNGSLLSTVLMLSAIDLYQGVGWALIAPAVLVALIWGWERVLARWRTRHGEPVPYRFDAPQPLWMRRSAEILIVWWIAVVASWHAAGSWRWVSLALVGVVAAYLYVEVRWERRHRLRQGNERTKHAETAVRSGAVA
jgi:hypothetical protein